MTPEFYLISQFSRFIRPGAVRVACNGGSEKSLTSVVFRNTDNNMVQVLVNQTNKAQQFRTVIGDQYFEDALPPKSVGSLVWKIYHKRSVNKRHETSLSKGYIIKYGICMYLY